MLNKVLPALLLAFPLLTGATQAEARGGGHSEFLEFVAPTPLPDPNGSGTLALCALKTKHTAYFIPLYYDVEGYALAANACQSERYHPVDAAKLAAGKEAGIFPAGLPDQPVLTSGQKLNGYMSLGLLGLIVLVGLRSFMRQRGARRRIEHARDAAMESLPPVVHRIADVTTAMAKADGEISPIEVTTITEIIRQLTGVDCDRQTIAEIALLSRSDLQPRDFKAFGKGLKQRDRELVLRAAMMVALADGRFEQSEITFISRLSKAFKISQKRRSALLQDTAAPA